MLNVAQFVEKVIHQNINNGVGDQIQDQTLVKDVFRVFHGFYGVLFISKFATGQVNSQGKDKGILSARNVWAFELHKFDRVTVGAAIEVCKIMHQQFPPSLPEFLGHCKALQPRKTYQAVAPEIEMGQRLRSEYAKHARGINAKHANRARDRMIGDVEKPSGLAGLKLAIAAAVGAAGGDECTELLRLDRMLATKR